MRFAYAAAMAALLSAPPAMAQVVIHGGGDDAARHEYRADEHRQDAHRDMREARERAQMGDYRGAERKQREAREHWAASRDQERHAQHEADRGRTDIYVGR